MPELGVRFKRRARVDRSLGKKAPPKSLLYHTCEIAR